MNESSDYKRTIKYTKETDDKLQKLADQTGRTKRAFFIQMVDYFYRTKKDPKDINDELLKKTLIKNHDTYIRFIRTQEDSLLIPIKENVDKLIVNQREIVQYFNEQVIGANKAIIARQNEQLAKGHETDKILQALYSRIETKEKLKAKFLLVLNTYIKMREELGSFKNREKEELAESVKKQIADL